MTGHCRRSLAAAGVALALSCGTAAAQTPANRLVVGLNADIRSVEPGVNRDANTDTVIHHLFDQLVAYKADLEVGPALADSWTIGDDGKTYSFKLREGATFHNGERVTASAFKWMWDRLAAGQGWACRNIFFSASGPKVTAVEAPDAATVVFRLDQPSAIFLKQLANIQCHVVAAHPASADAEGKWQQPIGSGPLKLKEWRRSEYVLLERHAGYKPSAAPASGFSGARIMQLDEVQFRAIPDGSAREAALVTNAVDLVYEVSTQAVDSLRQRGIVIQPVPGLSWSAILIQTQDPVLADPRVRRAIAHALDTRQIAEASSMGLAQANPSAVGQATPYFDQRFLQWPAHDPARARALAREGGYTGQTIKIQTNRQYSSMYNNAVMAEAMLNAAGFKAEIEVLDWATQLSNYLNGRFQMQAFGYSARFDPGLMYLTLIGDKSRVKTAQYDNAEARRLLAESGQTDDVAKRRELFAQIHDKVREDVPIIGLYFDAVVEAHHPRVKGYKPWSANRPITWGVSKQ